MKIHYLIWLLLSVIIFGYGEYLSKKLASGPRWFLVVEILVVYSFGVLAWLPAILQKNQLSIVGTLWSVMSSIVTLGVGLIIFHEKLTPVGVVGVVLAVISIALLSR